MKTDTPDTKHQSSEQTNTLKLKEKQKIHSVIHSFSNETTAGP